LTPRSAMIAFRMTRRIFQALGICAISLSFILAGCSTVDSRIQEKPAAFQRLSASDQALVRDGKIREGMSRDAVYIAWGEPSEHAPGRNRGQIVDTWIYYATVAGEYEGPFYYGYPYGYGLGYGFYGGRVGRFGRFGRFHGGLYYDPFFDPFFYDHANIARYPERIVSFQNGRVISFQFLPEPRYF
jgi:hypothetical protein